MPATYQLPYVYRTGGAGGTIIPAADAGAVHVSSNTAVITVNATGLVTAVGVGTATVTTTAGTATPIVKSFTVTYTAEEPPEELIVTSGVISPAAPTITNGATRQFAVGWLDQNLDPIDDTEAWSSSAPAVVSIDPGTGLATGEADAGTATITATSASQPGVTATTVATAAPAPAGFTPEVEWWPAIDGYNLRINTLDAVVNSETFGTSFLSGFDYDRGDGMAGAHVGVQPSGLLASTDGPERNRWSYYLSDRIDTTVGTAIDAYSQWDRHTKTAVAGTGWEVRCMILVGHNQLLGATDAPIRFRIHVAGIRGTAGKRLAWYAQQVGGVSIHPVTNLDVFVDGVEQSITFDFDWPFDLVVGGSIHAYLAFVEIGTTWAAGDYFEVQTRELGFSRRDLFDEPAAFRQPDNTIKGTIDFRGKQNNLPIHVEKGLPIFYNAAGTFWDGKSVVDLANIEDTYWSYSNWSLATSTDPGFYYDRLQYVPTAEHVRYWYDVVVQPGGTMTKVGTFQLLHAVVAPEYTLNALDANGDGTMAGRRFWLHQMWRAAPGQTIPQDGDFRATLTGDAAYTGLCRVVRDSADGDTYHILFPIMVATDNTAIDYTLSIENVSGAVQTFQIGPTWPDREVWNAINPRNAGAPSQWLPPRAFYGPGTTMNAATTPKRHRIDHSNIMADPFTNTLCRRDFLMWDLEDVRTRPDAQLKWFDSGPNATSVLTYLWEIITSTAGVPRFRVYIQHEGGFKGSTIDWVFDVGEPNPFRAYDYNDVAVICEEGAQAVYINGTWYDRTSPNFLIVDEKLDLTPWTQNEFTPIWFSMDRDLDCLLQAFMTTFALHNAVQTREAVEGYFAGLNAAGVVGQVAP